MAIPAKIQNLNSVIKNSALNIDKNFRTNTGFPSLSKKETIVHIEIYKGKGGKYEKNVYFFYQR